jgi:signal transduction histidine kinase
LGQLVDCSLRQLRTLVFELSPPLLDQSRLGPALEWLAEMVEAQWDLPVACEVSNDESPLPEATALILFRGARELLVNAAKHARATALELTLRYDNGNVEIEVCDDGIGLDRALLEDSAVPGYDSATGGFGLYNLRFRIEQLGGQVHIAHGSPGAQVRLTVPIDAERQSEQALTEMEKDS